MSDSYDDIADDDDNSYDDNRACPFGYPVLRGLSKIRKSNKEPSKDAGCSTITKFALSVQYSCSWKEFDTYLLWFIQYRIFSLWYDLCAVPRKRNTQAVIIIIDVMWFLAFSIAF